MSVFCNKSMIDTSLKAICHDYFIDNEKIIKMNDSMIDIFYHVVFIEANCIRLPVALQVNVKHQESVYIPKWVSGAF
jgi:hypothetical protein